MKIGTRLAISLVVPLVVLMVLFAYLDQRRSRSQLRTELVREGRAVARAMQLAIEDALRDRQLEDIRDLVDQVSGYERIFGIRIFAADQSLLYQSGALTRHPFQHFDVLEDVLEENRPAETYRTLGDQPVVTFLTPLRGRGGEVDGALQVIQLESFIQEDVRASRNAIAILTGALILATTTTIFLVARISVTRPIDELIRTFRGAGTGETPRAPVRRRDELGRLAIEFNGMWGRLDSARASLRGEQERRVQMESQLHDAQRLAAVGRLAAGLAHEIGTPLNVIRGRAETLRRKIEGSTDAESAGRSLEIIVAQIDRIARIVRDLLDFARPREPRLVPTDVGIIVRRVLEFLAPRFEENGITLEAQLAPDGRRVPADPDQLQQVFLNVAHNALDAMPRGGTLRVRTAMTKATAPGGSGIAEEVFAVTFADSGGGIAPEHLSRVFDPFFSTKGVGQGTGLGLSVSYGIVREHGGWLDLQSEAGRGAVVTVNLPCGSTAVIRRPLTVT